MSGRTLLLIFATAALPSLAIGQEAMVQGRTVHEWTQGLKSFDPRIRFWSLQALGEAGSESAPAAPALARLLKDPYPRIRREAAKLLAALGADAADAAPALAASLADSDAGVRQSAAQGLSSMGEKATPVLIEALKNKEPHARLAALGALEGMQASPEIARAVAAAAKDAMSATVRRAAVAVLAKYGSAEPEASEALVAALRDKDLSIRNTAASGLVALGKEAQSHFVKAFDNPNPDVRLTCLQGLAQLGEQTDAATIAVFLAGLDDPDGKIRVQSASCIGNAGTIARELAGEKLAAKLFDRAANDKEAPVRRASLWALGKVGIESADELKRLICGLNDADVYARGITVHSLGQYLHEETPADLRGVMVSALTDALKDRDRRVQGAAAELLARQGAPAVAPLAKLAERSGGTARLFAVYLLGEIGPPAAPALPLLEKMAKETTGEARSIALQAIAKIK